MTASELLQAGLAEHRAGNHIAAARLYCETLTEAPEHADALHLLGLLLSEQGEHGRALSLLSRALELRPHPVYLANLGLALRRAGDLEGAIASYRQVLRMEPLHAPTLGKLGRALSESGHSAEAESVLLSAVQCDGASPELRNALGHVRAAQGRCAEACQDFKAALALDPAYTEAADNCARALLQCGHEAASGGDWRRARDLYTEACRHASTLTAAWYHRGLAASALRLLPEARGCYERAIDLDFHCAEAHNNLGHLLQAEQDTQGAIAAYERALAIRPGYSDARYNLALTLQNTGRVGEARTQYELLLVADPGHADALNNLGALCLAENRLPDAKTCFERALARQPAHVDSRWNLSLASLAAGDFRRGWQLYEARLEQAGFPRRKFSSPRWRGQRLEGRAILVWSEQGLGDTIQFLRYLRLLTEGGARVVFEVQPRLHSLLKGLPDIEVVERGNVPPCTDYHIPLLSLAGCFPEIPPVWFPVPVAAAALVGGAGKKVGLCWAGHPDHIKGRNRSIPLAELAPLAQLQGVRLISLQRGPAVSEMDSLGNTWQLEVVEQPDGTVADLASLLQGLDLVISVDTMVAHLAATLGKPVWTLLPFAADWRWQLEREDSLWYPSMRLFRQDQPGQWASVVARVANCLQAGVEAKHR